MTQEIKNIPQKIYLQIGIEDFGEFNSPIDFNDFDEVSWCHNRIHESDIEFVLSSPPTQPEVEGVPSDEELELMACENSDCKPGNHCHDCGCSSFEEGYRKAEGKLLPRIAELERQVREKDELERKWNNQKQNIQWIHDELQAVKAIAENLRLKGVLPEQLKKDTGDVMYVYNRLKMFIAASRDREREAAEQFAEWIGENEYPFEDGIWWGYGSKTCKDTPISTSELYAIWQQSKNESNE